MNYTRVINTINYFSHLISFDEDRDFRKKIIIRNKEKTNSYDYGESFFYQSMPCINLNGLRNTNKRINKLKINKYIESKTILDIGTNIGGIILNMKQTYREAVGIDHNQKAIDIATMIQKYKKKNKIRFICSDFLKYEFKKSFDIIFSLANHSTYDKGIDDTQYYFEKVKQIISPKGILFLESHAYSYENFQNFEKWVLYLKKHFSALDNGIYDFGNFYDRKRRFYVLQRE